jgi:hypothetical protein
LLGVGEFNKSENVTKDYIERGFLPHAPTFRSSKPSPFSLSMFRWNTRKQYEFDFGQKEAGSRLILANPKITHYKLPQ